MKIVCIAASFIPSHTANSIQVVKATHALAELGHQVTLLVPGEQEAPWEVLKTHYGLQQPFKIRWIDENLIFKRYDFAYKAIQLSREINPDLIYTWVLQAGVLALWFRLPTILELHDRVTGQVGPWLFRKFCKSKTRQRILTNTDALRKSLVESHKLGENVVDIRVSPNGVELERYQELPSVVKAREILGLAEKFTAGYTGHFYAGRGMNLMYELAKTLPDINFLWVGGEPGDVALWEAKRRSDKVENLTMTGFVDNADLPLYQAAADVLLMPYGTVIAGSGGGNSVDIASPMKMFEYMAAGRAILSSDLPVIHEVLNEEMAVFCRPGDLEAWNNALLVMQSEPGQRANLAKTARSAVESYTWKARAERSITDFV